MLGGLPATNPSPSRPNARTPYLNGVHCRRRGRLCRAGKTPCRGGQGGLRPLLQGSQSPQAQHGDRYNWEWGQGERDNRGSPRAGAWRGEAWRVGAGDSRDMTSSPRSGDSWTTPRAWAPRGLRTSLLPTTPAAWQDPISALSHSQCLYVGVISPGLRPLLSALGWVRAQFAFPAPPSGPAGRVCCLSAVVHHAGVCSEGWRRIKRD